jgi:hypothetical protein
MIEEVATYLQTQDDFVGLIWLILEETDAKYKSDRIHKK